MHSEVYMLSYVKSGHKFYCGHLFFPNKYHEKFKLFEFTVEMFMGLSFVGNKNAC